MSKQIIVRHPSSNRRQPLLKTQASSGSSRLAEVAGGTTAECAAVCCCCPCGLVNLLVLAIYKVPAGLCRRAMRRKRCRQMKNNGLPPVANRRRRCSCGCDETELQIHPVSMMMDNDVVSSSSEFKSQVSSVESDKEVEELEKEMWDRFYSTGFWRSPSQREPSSLPMPSTK